MHFPSVSSFKIIPPPFPIRVLYTKKHMVKSRSFLLALIQFILFFLTRFMVRWSPLITRACRVKFGGSREGVKKRGGGGGYEWREVAVFLLSK